MGNVVKLEVWGDLASFNRPELKVERMTYEVMTPSAARGILEAIYWKPQMRWVVDAIHVLRPIRMTQIRRNEIDHKIASRSVTAAMRGDTSRLGLVVSDPDVRNQRAAVLLRDVCYGIVAHVEVVEPDSVEGRPLSDPLAKHLEMFKRRAARGQYFHHPYLGTRECPAEFRLVEDFAECPVELRGERDLGRILLDVDFVPDAQGRIVEANQGRRVSAQPRFFRAVLRDGVLTVPARGKEAVR